MGNGKQISVEERMTIKADIHRVWTCLADFGSYPQWNPFIVGVSYRQDKKAGELMVFDLVWDKGAKGRSIEQMVRLAPPENGRAELVYRYASILARLGLVRATRTQTLQTAGDRTEYVSREDFTGWLIRFLPIAAVRSGFQRQARALAAAVETAGT